MKLTVEPEPEPSQRGPQAANRDFEILLLSFFFLVCTSVTVSGLHIPQKCS
jgi:hypothetical protein